MIQSVTKKIQSVDINEDKYLTFISIEHLI